MVKVDGFEIDASLSEDHSFEAQVPEDPIEGGAVVSDHIFNRPEVVVIEGVVSDTPVGSLAERRSGIPSDEGLAKLMSIRARREPVTIETSLEVFDNMVLHSLNIPRNAQVGHALRFRATFKRIDVVTNERTFVELELPVTQVRRGNKASPPAPEGEQPEVTKFIERMSGAKTKKSWLYQAVH